MLTKYIIYDVKSMDKILGVIETDGCLPMLFKARRSAIDKLGNDCYTIGDIVEQARNLYPKYNFIYDCNIKDIVL